MMMHWGGRRRRNREPKPGSKEWAGKAVSEYATKLLYNRWKLLCPFEVPLDRIYQSLFTPEQHTAIEKLLRTAPTVFEMRKDVMIGVDTACKVTVKGQRLYPSLLHIHFPAQTVLFDSDPTNHPVLLSQLPMREEITEWARRWLVAAHETTLVLGKLNHLFNVCSTIGHVKRIWPNAANLLPERSLAKLAEAKVKSPYPADAMTVVRIDDDGKEIKQLADRWHPSELEWFDERLTEALCLPMVDGGVDFDVKLEYGVS